MCMHIYIPYWILTILKARSHGRSVWIVAKILELINEPAVWSRFSQEGLNKIWDLKKGAVGTVVLERESE